MRAEKGYVDLPTLFTPPSKPGSVASIEAEALRLAVVFNGPLETRARIRSAALMGDEAAANVEAWMNVQGIQPVPCRRITADHARELERTLLADPAGFLAGDNGLYPSSAGQNHWGFDTDWIRALLERSQPRLARFVAERRSDRAILVGNGPSLNQTDLSLLDGQDVFISNYATRQPVLAAAARAVAVSNYFVAFQGPEAFDTDALWRVAPVWLSHVLADSPNTIWLNALGGDMFFSSDPAKGIAWHATVSFLWLQLLYFAGYRKVLLIGVDNSYTQASGLKEGDLVTQADDDLNHFDASYFRGKVWQAADTENMARTYRLAREAYEKDGRALINCTVGGALEVLPRSSLEVELART